MNDEGETYDLAAIIASGEPEKLYSALSVLVSTAVDGGRCAALASFGGLAALLDPDLLRRAQEPEATPSLSWAGRETFAKSLVELRATAFELESLTIWACSASVETMGVTIEPPLAGVLSTPRFLRATAGARLIHA